MLLSVVSYQSRQRLIPENNAPFVWLTSGALTVCGGQNDRSD